MTFKHAKFEDSPVMRSLERIEKQKNPDSTDVFTKVASAQTDFSPTDSLVENILHLCAGLKQSGFDKHAEELESNFIRYKQAQTLYETSSETGDDLVEFAHGKSRKLDDVDSDMAIFYNIVDKQLDAIKMIGKTPTGKLASSRDVINAVKIVLAQATPDLKTLEAKFDVGVKTLLGKIGEVVIIANKELTFNQDDTMELIQRNLSSPILDNLLKAQSNFDKLVSRIAPGRFGGVSNDIWERDLEVRVSSIVNRFNALIAFKKEINKIKREQLEKKESEEQAPPKPAVTQGTSPFDIQSAQALSKVRVLRATITNHPTAPQKRKDNALKWLADKEAKIMGFIKTVKDAREKDPAEGESVAKSMMTYLDPMVKSINEATFS